MTKRLNLIIWGSAEHQPLRLSIAISDEVALLIQNTPVKATTLTIEEFIATPLTKFHGELDKFKKGE